MFEARMAQGNLLRKVIEAIKDLVTDANFDCTKTEFNLQAMDSSHVSLVALALKSDGFDHYRCDKPISMGARHLSLSAILVGWPRQQLLLGRPRTSMPSRAAWKSHVLGDVEYEWLEEIVCTTWCRLRRRPCGV